MRKIWKFVLIIGIVLILGAVLLFNYTKYSNINVKNNEIGNTPPNIINSGLVAKCGEWLYYCDSMTGKLSKVKINKSSKTQLSDDSAGFINVIGNWVYYRNISDFSKIYKVGTNGEKRTLICDDAAAYITVIDNWIYYRNDSDGKKIYKVRTDGKKRAKVSDDAVDELAVYGGYAYYRNETDGYKLYRIKTNGKDRQIVTEDIASHINIIDDKIYYRNDSKENKVYSVKQDGTDRKKVSDFSVEGTLVGNSQYLYFIGAEFHPNSSLGTLVKTKVLYRISKDGSETKKLDELNAASLSVFDDWVYYTGQLDYTSVIYKIKSDGTQWQNSTGVTDISEYDELTKAIEEGIEFNITNSTLKANYEKVKEIVAAVVKPDMTEVEKEAALHDFLITHTKYDTEEYDNVIKDDKNYNPYVHNESSVLLNGLGVCDGYAKAMKLLLDAVDIENWIVYGHGISDNKKIGHAWNMVKLDGIYYHLDTTWDDPVPDMGSFISYRYFNVSDDKMKEDHEWDYNSYNKCTSTKYSFMHDMEFANTNNKWIYYTNSSKEEFKLYKVKADGSNKTKLNDDVSLYIAIDGEWLYYSNYSRGGHLYKIKSDGTGKKELNSDWSIDIKIVDGWIHYTNKSDNQRTYKIKLDGSSRQLVK
jgi:hypothetical protein